MRFDYYSASVEQDAAEVLAWIQEGEQLVDVEPCRARNGYQRAARVVRGEDVLATAQWGGNGDRCHVYGSGAAAPRLAEVIRREAPGHRVTRVDVCEDWDGEGLFDALFGELLGIADKHRLKVTHLGDFHRAEEGRTLYVGSRQSAALVRCYEKGRQPGYRELGRPWWVRLECEVKPKSREQREHFGKLEPVEVWGAARWLQEVGEKVVGIADLRACRAGTTRRMEDHERSERWMLYQYGTLLEGIREARGSWEEVGAYLGERLAEIRREREDLAA